MTTLKFNIDAGILIRGRIRSQIEQYCWIKDINFNVLEDKGLLNSILYFKLSGSDSQINQAKKDLSEYLSAEYLNN